MATMASSDSDFRLVHEKRSAAYQSLIRLCDASQREIILQELLTRFELLDNEMTLSYREAVEQEHREHLETIAEAIKGNTGLLDALADLGWEVNFLLRVRGRTRGDLYDITMPSIENAEDSILHLFLFELLAPYVEADSYIELWNSDGDRWRLVFDGEHCEQLQATISWGKRDKKRVETDQERVIREWNVLSRALRSVLHVEVIGISEMHGISWTAFYRDQPLGKYTSVTEAYQVALQEVAERIK